MGENRCNLFRNIDFHSKKAIWDRKFYRKKLLVISQWSVVIGQYFLLSPKELFQPKTNGQQPETNN